MAEEYVSAYVLADIGSANIEEVRERLLRLPHVVLVHGLIGPDDILMYVEAGSYMEFMAVLDKEIRGLMDNGVLKRTETRLVLTSHGRGYTRDHNSPPAGSAWIFFDLDVGDPQTVVDELLRVEGVINAHAVLGVCDVIAYVETEDWRELMVVLDEKIRRVRGVRRTDTRLVLMRRARTARSSS